MAKKPKSDGPSAGLLAALKFIAVAQRAVGVPYTRHCVLYDDMAYATDGVLTAGHRIEEHLQAAPHTASLIAALERCGDTMTVALLPAGLSINAGRFKVTVPCHDLTAMPVLAPDPLAFALADDAPLRAALAAVGPLATEGAPKVAQAAILLSDGYAVATNGIALIQSWHGVMMPRVLVPKSSVKVIESVKKRIVGFGGSPSSMTFHFEGGSWIKTQLYVEDFPQFEQILDVKSDQWPLPPEFFEGLRTLEPFVQSARSIYLSKNKLHTHSNPSEGASYELSGVPDGFCFNIDMLFNLEGLAKKLDFGKDTPRNTLLFSGDMTRGAIMPKVWDRSPPAPPPPKAFVYVQLTKRQLEDMDDDIPF